MTDWTTMYTGKHAHLRPLQPAFIMAATGEAVTYRELEARSPDGSMSTVGDVNSDLGE